MKKYRERNEDTEIITGYAARYLEDNKNLEKTKITVWIGSSQYWSAVFLNTLDHKLYVRTDKHTYEALENLNIRKIETV
jgi:hypothetical protein